MIPPLQNFIPSSPEWLLEWDKITRSYPWISKLKDCSQDPHHHAEGDVLTHVEMVTRSGINNPEWQELNDRDKFITFTSFIGHDVAKPETRKVELDGSITNHGHSRMGANEMRQILWRMGIDWHIREQICSIISVHQAPFWLINKEDWQIKQTIIANSLLCNLRLLSIQADADAKGRIAKDQSKIIENSGLFRLLAEDMGCLDKPFIFANDHSRMQYFANPQLKDPSAELWDTTNSDFTVTLMSGIPGSGKSTWIRENTKCGGIVEGQPVISMDVLRQEMGVDPTENQGKIRQAVLAQARNLLAKRCSFIWDAVNLDWQRRAPLISLCMNYGARVRFVYVELAEKDMRTRNNERKNKVPDDVIDRLIRRWEPPTLLECHELHLVVPNYDSNPEISFST